MTILEPMMKEITQFFTSYPGMRAFSSRGSIISSNQGGTRTVVLNVSGADQQALFTTAQNVMTRAKEMFDNPRLGFRTQIPLFRSTSDTDLAEVAKTG